MTFDSTITLGALLNVGSVVISALLFITALRGRLDLVDQSVVAIEKAIEAIQSKLNEIAAQDKRLAILEERQTTNSKMLTTMQSDIHDLRRGDGFIRGGRSGIDGEYK